MSTSAQIGRRSGDETLAPAIDARFVALSAAPLRGRGASACGSGRLRSSPAGLQIEHEHRVLDSRWVTAAVALVVALLVYAVAARFMLGALGIVKGIHGVLLPLLALAAGTCSAALVGRFGPRRAESRNIAREQIEAAVVDTDAKRMIVQVGSELVGMELGELPARLVERLERWLPNTLHHEKIQRRYASRTTIAAALVAAISIGMLVFIPRPVEFCGQELAPDTVKVACVKQPIEDLRPLARLGSLERLDLSGTRARSLEPLRGLRKLEVLYLGDTLVDDISPLSELVSLRELSLTRTRVKDIRPLAGLTSLEVLFVNGTPVEDVTALASLHKLRTLHLAESQVHDVSALEKLENLDELLYLPPRLVGRWVLDLDTLEKRRFLPVLDAASLSDEEKATRARKFREHFGRISMDCSPIGKCTHDLVDRVHLTTYRVLKEDAKTIDLRIEGTSEVVHVVFLDADTIEFGKMDRWVRDKRR